MGVSIKTVYAGLSDIFPTPTEVVDTIKNPRATASFKNDNRKTLYLKKTYDILSVKPQNISITKPKANFNEPEYNTVFDNNNAFTIKIDTAKNIYILDIVKNNLFTNLNEADIAANKIGYPGRKNIIISSDSAYTVFSQTSNGGHIDSTVDYINHTTQEELDLLRQELNEIRTRPGFIEEERDGR